MNWRTACTPANLMTLFRLTAAPPSMLLLQWHEPYGPAWVAVATVVLGALIFLSDYFDGKVARWTGQVSDFGKVMDPVGDSCVVMCVLLGMAASPRYEVTVWFAAVYFFREVAMHVLRRMAALRNVVLAAGWAGKVKTFVQGVALLLFMPAVMLNDLQVVDLGEALLKEAAWWVGGLIAVSSVLSLIAYLRGMPAVFAESESA